MKNKKLISKLGYSDGSPFKDEPYLDIHTPNGKIDMSNTGVPLLANGRILPPYSGIHHFDTDIVREIPLPKAQSLGEIKDRLSNYLSGNEGLLPGNQTSIKQSVKDRLYNSVTPIAYDPKHAMKEFVAGKQLPFMWDGKETSFDEFQNQPMFRGDTEYGEYSKNASMDAWGNYLGMPQKYDTFKQSSYQPGSFSFNNDDDIWDDVLHLDIINKLKEGQDEQVYDSAAGGFSLNNYILKKELDKDIDMPYVSYRDKNDYNVKLGPFNIEGESIVGNPFNVYGRMYYDPETNERLSEEDIYKLKLDKSRNRNLQKQEGGEYEELELTDEEIEEYKKGGYVVEELPKAHKGYSPHYHNSDGSHVNRKDETISQSFKNYYPPLDERKVTFGEFVDKDDPRLTKYRDSLNAYNAGQQANQILWEQANLKPKLGSINRGNIYGKLDQHENWGTLNSPLNENTIRGNAINQHNWFNDDYSVNQRKQIEKELIDLKKNENVIEFSDPSHIKNRLFYHLNDKWSIEKERDSYPDINLPVRIETNLDPEGIHLYKYGNDKQPEHKYWGAPTFHPPKVRYTTGINPNSDGQRSVEPEPSKTPSYADAYKNVDKDKYPTLESFIEAAENYKKYGSNTKPESKSKETKVLKSKAEEKKLKKSITKKEVIKKPVIKKPEIPEGYALSKGYQRDGVSYGDMWHDIESTRPAISVGPTMDDYYAKYPKSSNIAIDDDFQSGGTVSQLWKQATGTPWSEAKKQGLTDGSYANNIALRKRIISGEFNSVPSETSSRYIKEDFDYEKYGENIKRLLEKGNTLDDLVRKRIGTRTGLTNMFPELFDMPQMPEIPEQTFEPLTQNLPDTVVEEDVEVSNDPIVNVPDWISNPAYTPPLTSNTQVKETQEEPAEIPSWINQNPLQIDPNYILPENKSVEEEPAEIPSWISQNPVQIDPNYEFPDKNKKQDGLKSFLSQFKNDEEVLDNEQRQSLYLSVDQEKDKQKKAELIQQKEKEYLEQLKIEEQQRIDDYKNKMLIKYGKDKISDLKQVGENVYEEAISNINEIKNNTQEKLNKISYYIKKAPWDKGYEKLTDYFEIIGDSFLRSEGVITSDAEEATSKQVSKTAFAGNIDIKTDPNVEALFNLNQVPFKDLYAKEKIEQIKTIKEVADTYKPISNINNYINKNLGFNNTKYSNFKLGKVFSDNGGSSTHIIDMSDGIHVTYQPRNENSNNRTNVNNAVTVSDYLYDQDFTDGYLHDHAYKGINRLRRNIGKEDSDGQKFVTIRKKVKDNEYIVKVIPFSELKEEDLGVSVPLPAVEDLDKKAYPNGRVDYINKKNIVYRQGYAKLSDLDISSDGNKIKLHKSKNMFKEQGVPYSKDQSGSNANVLRLPGGKYNYGKYQNIDNLTKFHAYFGGTVTIISDDGKIVKKVTGSVKDVIRTAQEIKKQTDGKEVHFLQSDAGSMNLKASADNNNIISKDRLDIQRNHDSWAGASEILLNKKLGGEINQFELGGQYMDLDLTEEEIKEYQKGGFVIEDLPKAQNLGQVPELAPSYEFPYEYLEENTGNPEERLQFYGVNDPAKGAYPGAFDFRKDLIKYSDFSQPIGTSNAEGFEESDFRNKRHRGRKRRRNLLKGFRKDYVDDFKSKSQEWNDAKTLFGQEPFGNYLDLLPLNYGGELSAHQAPPGQVISSTYSEYPFQMPEIVDTNLNDTITPYSNKKRFNSYTITGDPNKPHRRSAGNIIYDMFHKPGSSEIKHDFNFKDGGENKYQKPPGEVSSYGLYAPIDATNDWGDGRVSDGIDPEVQKRIDDYYYSIPRVVNDINKQSPMAEFTGIPSALRIIDHPKQIAKDVVNTAADVAEILNPFSLDGVGHMLPDSSQKKLKKVGFDFDNKNVFNNPYGSGIEGTTDAMIMAPLIKPAGNVARNVARNVLKSDKYVKPYLKNAYKYNPFATNLESKIAKENLLARQIYGDEAYEQFLKYGPTTEYGKNIPRHKQIREWLDADVEDVAVIGKAGKNKDKLTVASTMTKDRNFKYPYFQKSKLFFSPNERALYNADMGKGRVIIPKDVNAESFYPAGETSFIRNVDTAPKDAVKMYSGEKYILSPFDKNSFNSKAFDVYEETPHWLMGNRKLSNPPKNLSNKLPNQKVIHPIDYNPVTGNPNVYTEPYLMSRQIPFTKEEEVLQSFYSPEKQRKLIENNTIKYDPQGNIIPNKSGSAMIGSKPENVDELLKLSEKEIKSLTGKDKWVWEKLKEKMPEDKLKREFSQSLDNAGKKHLIELPIITHPNSKLLKASNNAKKTQLEWLNSDEWMKRRRAATGESLEEARVVRNEMIENLKNTKVNFRNTKGIVPKQEGFQWIDGNGNIISDIAYDESKELTPEILYNIENAINHEVIHGSTINRSESFKGIPFKGVTKKIDKESPGYIQNTFRYLNMPEELQVRGVRALEYLKKSGTWDGKSDITESMIKKLKEDSYRMGVANNDVANLASNHDVKSLTDFLKSVYAVPAAIGTGAVLSQEEDGGEIGYKSEQEIKDLINQGYDIEYLD